MQVGNLVIFVVNDDGHLRGFAFACAAAFAR